MFNHISKFKLSIIIMGIILAVFSSWYLLSNREIDEEPQRADLVYQNIFIEDTEDFHEKYR